MNEQVAGATGRGSDPSAERSADRAAWVAALDEFEQRLDGFHRVVVDQNEPPPGLWPPSDVLGRPFPPELADRARTLLDRARLVESELVARRTELPPPQRAPVRHRRRPVASTLYTAL
ncbi:MAG: hypothetical protein AAGA93_11750 [Actinomycetota bacterium]